MRHSSVKTIAAALMISATVLAAVPVAASSRGNQGPRTQTTRAQEQTGPSTDRFAAIRQFIQRTLRRLTTNGDGMAIPIPKNSTPPEQE